MKRKRFTISGSVSLFLLLLSLGSTVQAWTPVTSNKIATDATMLLPETLQKLVLMNWKDISLALNRQSNAKHEQAEFYYWHGPGKGGIAPEAIAESACKARKMIQNRKPFASVFYEFGKIAFLISESFNPLNTGNSDPDEIYYYKAFEELTESTSAHFRIQFNGYTIIPVTEKDVQLELESRFLRLQTLYKPLSKTYKERLSSGKPFDFGYQSIPFGIAMISYSRAVTTIVDVWCSVWKAAGGELNNPPFDIAKKN